MIQTFYINGVLPGLNEIIKADRTGRYVGARLKKKAVERVCKEILAAKLTPITGPVHLSIICGEPNKRRDPMNVTDGAVKIIADALVKMGIIEGDGWAVFGGDGGWSESVTLTPKGHTGGVAVSLRQTGGEPENTLPTIKEMSGLVKNIYEGKTLKEYLEDIDND